MEIMKVKKNNLKLLKNPDWFFFRNPDDCKFGSFKLLNSEKGNAYLIGRHKTKNTNIIIAKKCKKRNDN